MAKYNYRNTFRLLTQLQYCYYSVIQCDSMSIDDEPLLHLGMHLVTLVPIPTSRTINTGYSGFLDFEKLQLSAHAPYSYAPYSYTCL